MPVILDNALFSSTSSLLHWIFFPPFLLLLQSACDARLRNKVSQNGCWGRSGMRRAAPLSHSLSPSLSRAFTLPHASTSPSLPLTAPPHPFIFYLLLSFFPLSYSLAHTYALSLAPALHNYGCANSQPRQTERFAARAPQGDKYV